MVLKLHYVKIPEGFMFDDILGRPKNKILEDVLKEIERQLEKQKDTLKKLVNENTKQELEGRKHPTPKHG
jgi:regulator of replication initiation timing